MIWILLTYWLQPTSSPLAEPCWEANLTEVEIVLDGEIIEADYTKSQIITKLQKIETGQVYGAETELYFLTSTEGIYVAGTICNADIQAQMTTRDTTLYLEHCFEVFLDPNADGLDYYELQFNPLGTIWDLRLRQGGPTKKDNFLPWHIPAEQLAIKLAGSANDSSDLDDSWSFELFLSWSDFEEGKPTAGAEWKYNLMLADHSLELAGYYTYVPTMRGSIHFPEFWPCLSF